MSKVLDGWEEMGFPPPAGHPAAEEEVVLYQEHAEEIVTGMQAGIEEWGPINPEVVHRQTQVVKQGTAIGSHQEEIFTGVGIGGLAGAVGEFSGLNQMATGKEWTSRIEEYQFYVQCLMAVLLILLLWRQW